MESIREGEYSDILGFVESFGKSKSNLWVNREEDRKVFIKSTRELGLKELKVSLQDCFLNDEEKECIYQVGIQNSVKRVRLSDYAENLLDCFYLISKFYEDKSFISIVLEKTYNEAKIFREATKHLNSSTTLLFRDCINVNENSHTLKLWKRTEVNLSTLAFESPISNLVLPKIIQIDPTLWNVRKLALSPSVTSSSTLTRLCLYLSNGNGLRSLKLLKFDGSFGNELNEASAYSLSKLLWSLRKLRNLILQPLCLSSQNSIYFYLYLFAKGKDLERASSVVFTHPEEEEQDWIYFRNSTFRAATEGIWKTYQSCFGCGIIKE
eukprot:snap_masked-scaffold_6-processed-gene-12.34-mRNA-1 protein AED:1.00 eAED:1.00 QI:0/0/0/0/1/1/2/0/322